MEEQERRDRQRVLTEDMIQRSQQQRRDLAFNMQQSGSMLAGCAGLDPNDPKYSSSPQLEPSRGVTSSMAAGGMPGSAGSDRPRQQQPFVSRFGVYSGDTTQTAAATRQQQEQQAVPPPSPPAASPQYGVSPSDINLLQEAEVQPGMQLPEGTTLEECLDALCEEEMHC